MSLFSKFFKTSNTKPSSKEKKINEQPVVLSLDDLFVNNFINKGGKFLYCISQKEAVQTFKRILLENNWSSVSCINNELKEICMITDTEVALSNSQYPYFSTCEHLVADTGNIMISSNQIGEMKLGELNNNFIVMANTSQIVKNMGEGLTGIKSNCKNKIPTNICDIKNYTLDNTKDNFLNYGMSNSKNLYLILVEDL
ncbi:LUD domain-containing protein [Wenyingzhuangia aestuarii]|uniref:LUD domain-containing protein n=1 Tax=Wenyingzhuangia aestuarii TaxID=1647582 RepID=UPI00143BA10E|nr:LUD domain-containing protein [Wenyingzhuangia aestuarii]NJB82605.1 nitrogen-specific signal transduction histidine kinase [Wenyingzhuangia aestuarii]